LPQGEYPLGELAADDLGAYHYANLLLHEITSGIYPRGVRLDSSELVDRRSLAVFSAVVCGVIMPKILHFASELAGGVQKTERGFTKKDRAQLIDAFQRIISVITMGTDTEAEVNSFLDILAYLSGLTFVSTSSNSSFGVPGGDAEANLADVEKVTQAISDGYLLRGIAYKGGDGLVMTNVLHKTKPEAENSQVPILAEDERYYGATFIAQHARPISEISVSPGWFFQPSPPAIPDLPIVLSHLPDPESEGYIDYEAATIADQLMEVLNASQIFGIESAVPQYLRQGTRFIILEAPGRANGPLYELYPIIRAANQLEARTRDQTKPIFIVTSECLFPYATKDYGASVLYMLEQMSQYNDRVVNGRSLPAQSIRFLIAIHLIRAKVLSDFGNFKAEKEYFGVTAEKIQQWIDDYIRARNLPGLRR